MVFTRSPLLTSEVEKQLKKDLKPLWKQGYEASQIAKILGFGDPATPYKKLKKYHVWAYRSKFNFEKRGSCGIKKGQPRYKQKREDTMTFQEFQKGLDAEVPFNPMFDYALRKRAYLILSFWTPLRKTEIIERVRRDFKINDAELEIKLYRKKKFYKANAQAEPFFLPLDMPLVAEVLGWIDRFGGNEKPFSFSGTTAWKYVHETFGLYPHYFRFDYITKGVESSRDPGKIISELLMDTGLDIRTVTAYIMKNERFRGAINKRELEKLKIEGIIN